MNWEGAADQLLAAIDRLFGEAKTRFPAISAHIERAPYAYRFRISASLFYHDKKGDFEDLVVSFTCRPLGSSEAVKGIPAGASPTGHDILAFEIRRGDSAEIAILDPVVLPQGEDRLEYEEAVLSFIRAAIALLQDR